MDLDVKEVLRRSAEELHVSAAIPPELARRARRRRLRNGALAAVAAVALLAGTGFGIRGAVGLADGPDRRRPAGADDWRGIWPQASRAQAEVAQAAADRGDRNATWQLEPDAVVRRYARAVLGWPEVFFEGTSDAGTSGGPGRLSSAVSDCDPAVGLSVCQGARHAEVTVEQLLRRGRTGIWFVTTANEGAGRLAVTVTDVRSFVGRFMEARVDGRDVAHDFLTTTAATQYHSGEGGLSLFGVFGGYETVAVSPAGELDTYEVRVRIVEAAPTSQPGSFLELLVVGPNPGTDDSQALAVLSATRLPDGAGNG